MVLGVDSPFFSTILLFKNQLAFGGFLSRIPAKNGEDSTRMASKRSPKGTNHLDTQKGDQQAAFDASLPSASQSLRVSESHLCRGAGHKVRLPAEFIPYLAVVVKTHKIPFWGRCTTHVRTDFSGCWDVHWGYGILIQWPFRTKGELRKRRQSRA